MTRLNAIAAALALATFGLSQPAVAEPTDPLPGFDLGQAITCLAYRVADVELNGPGPNPATLATELVFLSRLIAIKSGPEDHAAFDARFAEEVAFYRSPSFEEGQVATPDEVDEILTGTGKMCWFEALAAEGGPFYEE